MKYINIKNTDLNVSGLCFGVADIGVKYSEKQGFDLLDAYLYNGGNFIDTARVYSNWVPGEKNRSERIIGDHIAARGNRDSIILATKGGHPNLSSMHIPRLSRQEVTDDLNGSLHTLRVDYIDLYYLHRDDPNIPVEEIIEMLEKFRLQGMIRYYACSNWTAERLAAAQTYAKSKGYLGFVANEPLWNVGCYNMKKAQDPTIVAFDKNMYDFHRDTGMAVIPFSSQANGFFTKVGAEDEDKQKKAKQSLYYTDKNIRLYHEINCIANDYGMTITEVVLNYLISQPIDVIPIIGCRNMDQLNDSMSVIEKPRLPLDIVKRIELIAQSGIKHQC